MKKKAARARRGGFREAPLPRLLIGVSGADARLTAMIRRAARRALLDEGVMSGCLEIAVVGEREMCRQHKRWMGDPSPTDVLTFDLREGTDDAVDGLLYVCGPVAKRRAMERGMDWHSEVLLYVVHGVLHLCGYDDRTKVKAARMHRREDRILSAIGIGPVYAAGRKKSSRARRV